MQKLFTLVVLITVLDFGFTRPLQNAGKIKPKFVVVNLYDNVTLTCPFNTQSIKFSKDGQPIGVGQTTTQNGKYLISGNSLTLIRYVIMDSGHYSCSGRDANGGTKKFSWALHINLTRTTSSQTPQSIERPEKRSVILDCRFFSDKRLFYSMSNGNPVSEISISSHSRITENAYAKGLYQLDDLKIADTGFYYCGQSDLTLHLVVREPPKVLGNSLVKAGGNANFTCKYRGPQTIAWYKDGKMIQDNRDGEVKNTNQKNMQSKVKNANQEKQSLGLRLSNITSSGTYSCGATFDNNETIFTTIKLEIFEITKFDFLGKYDEVGETVYVWCASNQGPNATYELWKKPLIFSPGQRYKKVKTGSGIQELSRGVYVITSLSKADEGYYECRASLKGVTVEKKNNDPIWLS